jgi:hypothetical protein
MMLKKTLGMFLIICVLAVFLLFSFRLVSAWLFWGFLIFAAIMAYIVLPRLPETKSKYMKR